MSPSDDSPQDATSVTNGTGSPKSRRPRKRSTQRGMLANGVVLNGIYKVKRFLARGGMGEVYEGFNVSSEERVAIKVMLSHLAADAKVQALFRKEARTLTNLAHPALVQYRVLAREPTLDLYYIVTDFIDGVPLSDLIGKFQPSAAQLVMVTRRLAEGLGAAHHHGAIHRDMSPENVLLPGGLLGQAKIIDFGIAKSLDVGAQTVVGDGFAGKLGYVAPEQFGDFDRRVGPWTDIYSLGLVVLGLAAGRAPDMGTTLVEAVDRRRAGPDISMLPEVLQPLFRRMLTADPSGRPQTAAEVIASLDALGIQMDPVTANQPLGLSSKGDVSPAAEATIIAPGLSAGGSAASSWGATPVAVSAPEPSRDDPKPPESLLEVARTIFMAPGPKPDTATAPNSEVAPAPKAVAAPSPKPAPIKVPAPVAQPAAKSDEALEESEKRRSPIMLIGGVVAGLVLVVGLAIGFWPKTKAAPQPVAIATANPFEKVAEAALPNIPCSWLDIDGSGQSDPKSVKVSGVAGDPVKVNQAISAAAQAGGATGLQVDTAGVGTVPLLACPMLDAVRAFRPPPPRLVHGVTPVQPRFEVATGLQGCPDGAWAQPMVSVTSDPNKSFTLVAVQASGRLQQMFADQAQLNTFATKYPDRFKDEGGGRYRILSCLNEVGPAGMLMIQGAGPFDLGLRTGVSVRAPKDFPDRLRQMAKARGWTLEMAWFQLVNEQPDLPVAQKPDATKTAEIAPDTLTQAGPETSVAPVATEAPKATSEAPVQSPSQDWAACRRFVGGRWEEQGYASRQACAQRLFSGHCEVMSGQSGDVPLRRYNGHIQGKLKASSGKWSNLAGSDCPG